MADTIPPLPAGFELESDEPVAQSAIPPLPAGFELEPDTPSTRVDATPTDEGLDIEIVDTPANRKAAQEALVNDMSNAERFGIGVGKSIADSAVGAGQVLSSEIAPYLYGIPGLVTRELGRRGAREEIDQFAREAAERDAPLMETGAGLAGNITGSLAQILGPGIAARGTTASSAILPTTIRGNALQGAYLGALQPTTEEGQREQNIALGGALGGAGAGLVNGAGALIRGARNVLARGGLTSTDRRAANVLAREATNPDVTITESAVPGVQRTLGEASNDPGLMALENTLRAQQRGAFDPIDLQNNAARVEQLQRIAGTDADMAAAEAARTAASESLRDRAFAEGADSARQLQQADALMIPNAGSGMGQLRQGIQSIARSGAGNPNVQNATNAVSRALDQTGDSVAGLYNVRKYIGDLLNGRAAGDDASARAASRELIQMRDMIDENLASRAPSFPEYLDAYRNASKPINRMEVGREVLSRASGMAQDVQGNPILTPSGVYRATNDLDAIAAKATDFKKAKASDILNAQDLASLRAIQDDMQRIAQRNRSAAVGSQTAERLSVGERAAVRGVASKLPWVGPLFEHFEGAANQRLNERLAYLMANPAEAKRVMAALPKSDASALRTTLNQLALATNRAAVTSEAQQ